MPEIKHHSPIRGMPIDPDIVNKARMVRGWGMAELAEKAGIGIGSAWRACNGKSVSPKIHHKLAYAFDKYPADPVVQRLHRGEIDDPKKEAV